MSNIHSSEEAYESIADGLNYLIEHHETFPEVTVIGHSARIVFDEDTGKWFVENCTPKIKEGD